MNFVQAVGVVAKGKGDAIVVATMGAMFIFDRIEGADGHASGVPMVSGTAGLVLGLEWPSLRPCSNPRMRRRPRVRSPGASTRYL